MLLLEYVCPLMFISALHESFDNWTMCALWLCIFSRKCLWPISACVLVQWKTFSFHFQVFQDDNVHHGLVFYCSVFRCLYTCELLVSFFLLPNNDPLISSFASLYTWALGHSSWIPRLVERNNKLVWLLWICTCATLVFCIMSKSKFFLNT